MTEQKPAQLNREDLVRHVGSKPGTRVFQVFLWSVVASVIFFLVGQSLAWGRFGTISALITGVFYGIFIGFLPVGFILAFVVQRVYVKHTLIWSFSSAVFFAMVGIGVLGADYYAWCGGVGLCIGSLLAWFFGPRNMVYRYGRCPGCKYNLELLPKSDVCPECGRDNRDLVEIFSDVQIEKKRAR